ncbi:hypothetical protein PoB_000321100 [Plakobranchus ocellatus]|uniref:Uncharacterized protein n=1 Tax=Plakobranchus ocellatus TaxID=259542 RepID=A0AAV3Y2L1_9GAST|nr:hypothetical protein PoB_000321100 [Plakobranchus ocellatus]
MARCYRGQINLKGDYTVVLIYLFTGNIVILIVLKESANLQKLVRVLHMQQLADSGAHAIASDSATPAAANDIATYAAAVISDHSTHITVSNSATPAATVTLLQMLLQLQFHQGATATKMNLTQQRVKKLQAVNLALNYFWCNHNKIGNSSRRTRLRKSKTERDWIRKGEIRKTLRKVYLKPGSTDKCTRKAKCWVSILLDIQQPITSITGP